MWSKLVSIIALIGVAAAQSSGPTQGFNYGNLKLDGSVKVQADYEAEFRAAKALNGTDSRFTAARLYTTVQGGNVGVPIEAIQAAINTQTSLLLGMWCSAGDAVFANELASLKSALTTYGDRLRPLLQGISVGSEDLYRFSPLNKDPLPGASPEKIVDYIRQTRAAVKAFPAFGNTPVGHVDTWNAYVIGTNAQVITEVDFVGVNAFPYFQSGDANSPQNLPSLFSSALAAVRGVSQGKTIWVTETGFPVYGPTYNLAVPSIANAQRYWKEVGCAQLFGQVNTWWYTLMDGVSPAPANAATGSPSFGVVAAPLKDTSIFDLSCGAGAAASVASSSGTTSLRSNIPLPVATPSNSIESRVSFTTGSTNTFITLPGKSGVVVTVSGAASSSLSSSSSSSSSSSPPSSSSSSSSSASQPTSSSSLCPANLQGQYEFPHLLVPVSSTEPNRALGTSYFGEINSTRASIYNFDINGNLAGKTCSLVWLFPKPEQTTFKNYDFNGRGGLLFRQLASPATQQTSFANSPAASGGTGGISTLQSGNSYVVGNGPCPAGQTIAWQVSSVGGLALRYFQDYNPAAPIGLFVRAC